MDNQKMAELIVLATELLGINKGNSFVNKVELELEEISNPNEKDAYIQKCIDELRGRKKVKAGNSTLTKYVPIAILTLLFVAMLGFFAFNFFGGKKPAKEETPKTVLSDTVSKKITLPKEEWRVEDFEVGKDGKIQYKEELKQQNPQGKVVINSSANNSLSDDASTANAELKSYMKHYANALKDKAVATGVMSLGDDIKNFLEVSNDKVYLNSKGKEAFFTTSALLDYSEKSVVKLSTEEGLRASGVSNGEVVMDSQTRNYSGWKAVKYESPKNSKVNYVFYTLTYCGNTLYKNPVKGFKQAPLPTPAPKVEPIKPSSTIPDKPKTPEVPKTPDKPKTPDPKTPEVPKTPDKPKTPDPKTPEVPTPPSSSLEQKKAEQDPASQGKAPIGGGIKEEADGKGSETKQEQLPSSYKAPEQPSVTESSSITESSSSSTTQPQQWQGAGTVVDSNGTTKIEENGAVTTPDGTQYGSLNNSVPTMEQGANGPTNTVGTTASSSAASFTKEETAKDTVISTAPSSSVAVAGNGEMSEPAIDD